MISDSITVPIIVPIIPSFWSHDSKSHDSYTVTCSIHINSSSLPGVLQLLTVDSMSVDSFLVLFCNAELLTVDSSPLCISCFKTT
ncbi:unnamed protein product [Mycena citricolor]|uniref:Uncharacterized protein n=1 Tax=Mycena citricolor TaxID=2018698 RepID=A0AAD2Q0E1_9AGAR|nr:unnamed protein product [Mycena citricolor]